MMREAVDARLRQNKDAFEDLAKEHHASLTQELRGERAAHDLTQRELNRVTSN